MSTDLLQVFGTIIIPHATAMCQSRTKNDNGRVHKTLVTGQNSKKTIDSKKGVYLEGTATIFCPELRLSLPAASREYVPKHKKKYREVDALAILDKVEK